MAYKKFSTQARGDQDDPTVFELDGVGVLDGEPWSERFKTVPVVPVGVIDALTSSMGTDDHGNTVFAQPSLLKFMRGLLYDEDIPRFDALMGDKNRAVDINTLGEIMLWLAEEKTGRPTMPSSNSGDGRRPTATTSPAASTSSGSTPIRLAQPGS